MTSLPAAPSAPSTPSMSSMPSTDLEETAAYAQEARERVAQVVHGQEEAVTLLLVALGARGHVLLEGIPGVGKTTLAKTFARVTGLEFKRIQLTPDLMPADITGHTYYHQGKKTFELRQGPVFTNVLLADELNRTPPRNQAALLEVMEEHQVTIDGTLHPMPDPFVVIATKNPIETEGVYNLPEAELDRFMVHTRMDYPGRAVEAALLGDKLTRQSVPEPLPGLASMLADATATVQIHPDLRDYLLDLVTATRDHDLLDLGASPRAAVQFMAAARAHAVLEGRDFVVPDDIKRLAVPVLGHRVLLSAEAEMRGLTGDDVIADLIEQIPVPVLAART